MFVARPIYPLTAVLLFGGLMPADMAEAGELSARECADMSAMLTEFAETNHRHAEAVQLLTVKNIELLSQLQPFEDNAALEVASDMTAILTEQAPLDTARILPGLMLFRALCPS